MTTEYPKKDPRKFDYTKIDHKDKCKKEPVICPLCMEKENKIRLGHRTRQLADPIKETATDILVERIVDHSHFAMLKGTQTSAIDEARNVRCVIEKVWVNKNDECYRSYRLKKEKK